MTDRNFKLTEEFCKIYLDPYTTENSNSAKVRDVLTRHHSNTTIAKLQIDNQTPIRVFQTSKPDVREAVANKLSLDKVKDGRQEFYEMTLQQLVDETLKITGQTVEQLVSDALLTHCQKQLSMKHGATGTGRNRENSTKGVAGAADQRIEESYRYLIETGQKITASSLAGVAGTNYNTAKRFLETVQN